MQVSSSSAGGGASQEFDVSKGSSSRSPKAANSSPPRVAPRRVESGEDADQFNVQVEVPRDWDLPIAPVLEPAELLVSIRIPTTWDGADTYFEKVADRSSWDFALASVAGTFRMNGAAIADARIVCGAVQCIPRRFEAVERFLRGKTRSDETAEAAGALAVEGAEPLGFNGYKVPLTQNLVKRAVLGD